MMMASEASASVTSDSVMPPTAACSTRAATSSVLSSSNADTIASTEPCTSPLMTTGNSLRPVAFSWLIISTSEERVPPTRAAAISRF